MNLYTAFGTNKELEQEGVYLQYGENSQGQNIRFRVARAGGNNKAYNRALERRTRPHKRAITAGTLDEKQAEAMLLDVFIDTVLLGWEGVEDQQGDIIPYSKQAARQLMQDLPDLYTDLREQTNSYALFQQDIEAGVVKNSGTLSSTS